MHFHVKYDVFIWFSGCSSYIVKAVNSYLRQFAYTRVAKQVGNSESLVYGQTE